MTLITECPQQRYLEAVVKVVPCSCGCGSLVEVKRYATFPSYMKKRKYKGHFILGHKSKEELEATKERNAKRDYLSGEDALHWKGGKFTDKNGYVWINVNGEFRQEHRLVVEKALGRKLKPNEIIHHKKRGNKANNSLSNLKLTNRSDHAR